MVCCHKKDIYKETDLYLPIQVGKALSDISLNMLSDDTGDNISHKNNSYCELTRMYRAWKNLKGIDHSFSLSSLRHIIVNYHFDVNLIFSKLRTKQF